MHQLKTKQGCKKEPHDIFFCGFRISKDLHRGEDGTQSHFPDLVQIGVIHIQKCIHPSDLASLLFKFQISNFKFQISNWSN